MYRLFLDMFGIAYRCYKRRSTKLFLNGLPYLGKSGDNEFLYIFLNDMLLLFTEAVNQREEVGLKSRRRIDKLFIAFNSESVEEEFLPGLRSLSVDDSYSFISFGDVGSSPEEDSEVVNTSYWYESLTYGSSQDWYRGLLIQKTRSALLKLFFEVP